ncbi:MAG: preprotein translocase subunit SecG [Candidatus Improbicoccus devescovinae]|nr:MAG: preprotein translocase subunit SecG [Candidatus Improbicoccus devescovinae]
MSTVEWVLGFMLIGFSIAIISVVLFQEGQQQSAGGIMTGGGGDTFLNKNKARSIDAFLERWTRFIAVVFFLLVIIVNMVSHFHLFGA